MQALCKVLYTFCKIRGPKVISRFLSNEPKHIVRLLEALESWVEVSSGPKSGTRSTSPAFAWEEKYILLLWLSHLLLAPFDLNTIASSTHAKKITPFEQGPPHLNLPSNLPTIVARLVRIAIAHLHSAGKERDAAIALLVRLALRLDMQKFGLYETLIRWTISKLENDIASEAAALSYRSIGLLSFLARLVKSANAIDIAPYLLYIFKSIRKLNLLHLEKSSALARKATTKLYSGISLASLQLDQRNDYHGINLSENVLEDVINDLIFTLADGETPVRQAASKALSLITTRLEPEMGADISEAIIESLNENVLWEPVPELSADGSQVSATSMVKRRNLAAVNPLRWQGLVLTLSHLLFRRSLQTSQLPAILKCLVSALSFEQRSPSGAAIGSNVRDGACFGIWALSRRYSSEELSTIGNICVISPKLSGVDASIFQTLAVELVVAATIDPSGNIRRGASAALQELIGRHPYTVYEGINLVQIVDYHAVALRSRALTAVAIKVASLGDIYWRAIIEGLTTWRGIGAVDAESRRLAAEAIGYLTYIEGQPKVSNVTKELWQSLNGLDGSSVPKRQGFMLAIAAMVRASRRQSCKGASTLHTLQRQWDIFSGKLLLVDNDFVSATLSPDLTAEGACSLMTELARASSGNSAFLSVPSMDMFKQCFRYIDLALDRKHTVVLERAAEAAEALLRLQSSEARLAWIQDAVTKCTSQRGLSISGSFGHLFALGSLRLDRLTETATKVLILDTILAIIRDARDVDARITATKSLKRYIANSQSE